jgi:hypothetical protein
MVHQAENLGHPEEFLPDRHLATAQRQTAIEIHAHGKTKATHLHGLRLAPGRIHRKNQPSLRLAARLGHR